jgi:hypothetical protein
VRARRLRLDDGPTCPADGGPRYRVVDCPDYGRPFAVVDWERDLVVSKHGDAGHATRAAAVLNSAAEVEAPNPARCDRELYGDPCAVCDGAEQEGGE